MNTFKSIILLASIPYFNNNLLSIISYLSIFSYYYNLKDKYDAIYILKIIKKYILYITIYFLYNIKEAIALKQYKVITLNIIFKVFKQHTIYNSDNHILVLNYLQFTIPSFVFRIINIIIIYFLNIERILKSTKCEYIFCILINKYKHFQKNNQINKQNLIIITICLVNHILYSIILNFQYLYRAVQIKYAPSIRKQVRMCFNIIKYFILELYNDINVSTKNLWNRNINTKNFYTYFYDF